MQAWEGLPAGVAKVRRGQTLEHLKVVRGFPPPVLSVKSIVDGGTASSTHGRKLPIASRTQQWHEARSTSQTVLVRR